MSTPDPQPTPAEPRRLPWRSAALGWAVAAVALAGGVPLFLCMPPWNDVTLHDMAVRAMLRGGVHYRDVFDTNLPGIDGAMAAVRATCGWGYEALRAWDLAVIAGAVAVLAGWVRRAGGCSPTSSGSWPAGSWSAGRGSPGWSGPAPGRTSWTCSRTGTRTTRPARSAAPWPGSRGCSSSSARGG